MSTKVLIANRGEIALRIMRACRELGLSPVAIYSEADQDAPHTLAADEAYCIGPAAPRESYLSIQRVMEAAGKSGARLVHPGYGFLSENAGFARAVLGAGLAFVGPSPEAIFAMGSKALARQRVSKAGVPCVPGYDGAEQDLDTLRREAERVGLPVLIKPADGGGGKGMLVVESLDDLSAALASAKRLALSSFGSERLIVEKFLKEPRHVEVQVFGDADGEVVHLFERECSVQRRHQKIIEETPCVALSNELRQRMCEAAQAAARSVGYQSAGTVEFLLDQDGSFYFLEMNTRLQVEHPVTEWVTGLDLVGMQLRLALGEKLSLRQSDILRRGHAIEARIYAEDAATGFLPSAGRIAYLREPSGPFVRVDSGIREGYDVPVEYDPMLAKLSVWGETRARAIRRMLCALAEYEVLGVCTNVAYLMAILEHEAFSRGETSIRFLEEHLSSYEAPAPGDEVLVAAAAYELLAPAQAKAPVGDGLGGDPYSPWRPGALGRG